MDTAQAIREGKSMFGSQVLSARGTAPAFGFGTSDRASLQKLFLTKEQTAGN
jgi:hypothetical protein